MVPVYWDLRWAQSPATQYSDSRRYSWPTITSTASTPTPWKVTGSSWSHLWFPEAGEEARDQPLHPSFLHPPLLGRRGGNWLLSRHSLLVARSSGCFYTSQRLSAQLHTIPLSCPQRDRSHCPFSQETESMTYLIPGLSVSLWVRSKTER